MASLLRRGVAALLPVALAVRSATPADDVYESVLRQYCAPALLHEYEALPARAQGDFLHALQYTVEATYQQLLLAGEGDGSARRSGGRRRPCRSRSSACSVVKALGRKARSPDCIDGGVVDTLTGEVLRDWGMPQPKAVRLLRHEFGLRQHRQLHGDRKNRATIQSTSGTAAKQWDGRRCRRRSWESLKKTSIAGLPLFQEATGKVLEGKLLVEPVVSIGITTLLEDDSGDMVQLGLYNALPGGATGMESWNLANRSFPKGARLRIAEPYLKIFRDGQRGVRVDDPADLSIEADEGQGDLSRAKRDGNKLFKSRQYHAAAEVYWSGLRGSTEDAVVLLSNRAQALLKQERWASALQDSATAILLDPTFTKSWLRYEAALRGLGLDAAAARAGAVRGGKVADAPQPPDLPSAKEALRKVLLDLFAAPATAVGDGEVQDLKARGNRAYVEGRYREAERLYSEALSATSVADMAAVVLSNAAQCALATGTLHDAVAAAAASIRLQPSAKAVHRLARAVALLGDVDLADELLAVALGWPDEKCGDVADGRRAKVAALREDLRRAAALTSLSLRELQASATPDFVMDWVLADALEVVDLGDRGRGVRAVRGIAPGEVLVIQRPRCGGQEVEGEHMMSVDHSKGLISDGSQTKLKAQLTAAVAEDALLASTADALYDGRGETPPVVPLNDLLDQFSPRVLPLLRQHPDFFPVSERLEIGYAQISGVVDINCHGSRPGHGGVKVKTTELYPAISMLNHAASPNAGLFPIFKRKRTVAIAVVAYAHIEAGEEVTVSYGEEEVVRMKWGIVS